MINLIADIKALVALNKAKSILDTAKADITPENMTKVLEAVGLVAGPVEALLPPQYRLEATVGLAAAFLVASYIAKKEGGVIPAIPGIPSNVTQEQIDQVIGVIETQFPVVASVKAHIESVILELESKAQEAAPTDGVQAAPTQS